MKTLEIEHRGVRAIIQCEDGFEGRAREKVEREINYQLDEKPKREKYIAEFKRLRAKRVDAHKRAIENLRFTFPPLLTRLLKEYSLEDVVISNQNIEESPLNVVVPQLRALASDIHYHRRYLDQKILQTYWGSEEALANHLKPKK